MPTDSDPSAPSQSKNKSKPSKPGRRLQHIPDPRASGWTVVTRKSGGRQRPSARSAAETSSTTSKSSNQALSADDNLESNDSYASHEPSGPPRIDPDVTLYTLDKDYTKYRHKWHSSSLRKYLHTLFERIPAATAHWNLQTVLCLALGSFSRSIPEPAWFSAGDVCATSLLQLAVLEDLCDTLRERGHSLSKKLAQDPAFTELDKQFLRLKGYEILKVPQAERYSGLQTFAFIMHGPRAASGPVLRSSWNEHDDETGNGHDDETRNGHDEETGNDHNEEKETERRDRQEKSETCESTAEESKADKLPTATSQSPDPKASSQPLDAASASQYSGSGYQGPGLYMGNDLEEEYSRFLRNLSSSKNQAPVVRYTKLARIADPPADPGEAWTTRWLGLREAASLPEMGMMVEVPETQFALSSTCVYWVKESVLEDMKRETT